MQKVQRELSLPGQKNGDILFLFGAYQIGKERVFLSVANHLNAQVHVDRNRQRGMLQYEGAVGFDVEKLSSQLTTDPSKSCVWVKPMNNIR